MSKSIEEEARELLEKLANGKVPGDYFTMVPDTLIAETKAYLEKTKPHPFKSGDLVIGWDNSQDGKREETTVGYFITKKESKEPYPWKIQEDPDKFKDDPNEWSNGWQYCEFHPLQIRLNQLKKEAKDYRKTFLGIKIGTSSLAINDIITEILNKYKES